MSEVDFFEDFNSAKKVAEDVVDDLKEAGIEVTDADALKQLAVKDAARGITDGMDADEVDQYLDEFEDALGKVVEKDKAIEDRIDDADETPKEAPKGEPKEGGE